MVQRYKFESKSQQRGDVVPASKSCFQWFKGTNLKANHNLFVKLNFSKNAVSNGSKVQIWKQITTWHYHAGRVHGCFQWFKGTNLKANHNTQVALHKTAIAVSNGSKVQIWKQITTSNKHPHPLMVLFPMVQRYKFESKSQRFALL